LRLAPCFGEPAPKVNSIDRNLKQNGVFGLAIGQDVK
jgi:hypothetical protein